MEIVSKDVFLKLAFELDLPSLLSLCESSKVLNEKFCQKDELWLGRLKIDFPYRQINFNLKTPKETYLYLYQILNKIKHTQDNKYPKGFSNGVFIRKPLLDFFTNADFGTLKDGTKINDLVSDVMKLGLMSRPILTQLVAHYVKKNIVKNDGVHLHSDPLMELYLSPYFDDLERKDRKNPRVTEIGRTISPFNRKKFKFSDFQRILEHGIVTKKELTPNQIEFLTDGRTREFLAKIRI